MSESRDFLAAELRRLGARKEVLSTNVQLRLDGVPYSNRAQPEDPGAAVYFELKGKPVSLACDKWLRVEDNVYAIAKHIESLRAQDRWGVGSIERAFTGYMALPAVGESSASDWWKTLGVPINATPEQVREAYRLLVRKHHPDVGGDPEMFHRVQSAMDKFEAGLRRVAA
ncbi:MAG TPA: J domain-containing protein [Candidatus Saccharimonadales bacterium]|nr:J domain-containing protein [Candidatus Saccharimonadales bacterium]